ncbi:MAG: endonuclease/exonuclease/phosphatase family protein [Nitrospirae bacterium]|nr:endonuclease/exonuclease/phosphatase family protein [Nitrospirota bacterium]
MHDERCRVFLHPSGSRRLKRMKRPLPHTRPARRIGVLSAGLLSLCLTGWAGCGATERTVDSPIRVMTFNVLCSFCNLEDFDPWEERLAYFADILARHDPDLIGLQELMLASEVEQLRTLRPGYEAVFFHNEQGLKDYPDATILYRSSRYELLESGSYWLSPTPDEPWSVGFSKTAQLFRLVLWARLEDESQGRELFFVTTHFDNNAPSQDLSAPLLLERTAPMADRLPVVVTGDFNSQTFDPAYHVLVEGLPGSDFRFTDAYEIASERRIETNLDPPPPYDAVGRIDHIFLAGHAWRSREWAVDMTTYGSRSRYPSDHFPVAAVLEW